MIIKITAWLILIFSILISFSFFAGIFLLYFLVPEARMAKMFYVDIIIFIVGCLVLVFGFGMYEFFMSALEMEDEVKELDDEMKKRKQ